MPIMSWLQRRPSGLYRVRRVVPERLREYFDGRTIITRGLGTRDPVVAKRKGLVVAAEIERQFAEADAALKNPTVATYKAIQKYAEEDRQRPRSDREEEGFDSWLDDRLEEEDRGERVLSERDRAMLLGLLKRNTQNNGGDDNPPLSILFDRWHAERKPPAKTWLEWKTALRCFTEANGGDLPVKAITTGHVRTFKAALLNRKNSNDATKSLGLASVQKNLTALHTVLEYAVRQGYVETNAASKVGESLPPKLQRRRARIGDFPSRPSRLAASSNHFQKMALSVGCR